MDEMYNEAITMYNDEGDCTLDSLCPSFMKINLEDSYGIPLVSQATTSGMFYNKTLDELQLDLSEFVNFNPVKTSVENPGVNVGRMLTRSSYKKLGSGLSDTSFASLSEDHSGSDSTNLDDSISSTFSFLSVLFDVCNAKNDVRSLSPRRVTRSSVQMTGADFKIINADPVIPLTSQSGFQNLSITEMTDPIRSGALDDLVEFLDFNQVKKTVCCAAVPSKVNTGRVMTRSMIKKQFGGINVDFKFLKDPKLILSPIVELKYLPSHWKNTASKFKVSADCNKEIDLHHIQKKGKQVSKLNCKKYVKHDEIECSPLSKHASSNSSRAGFSTADSLPSRAQLDNCNASLVKLNRQELDNGGKAKLVESYRNAALCCNKYFTTAASYRQHRRRIHGEKTLPQNYNCGICNQTYLSRKKLFDHGRNAHGKEPCDLDIRTNKNYAYCEKELSAQSSMSSNHMFTFNITEPLFECTLCGQSYVTSSSVLRHAKQLHKEFNFTNWRECGKCIGPASDSTVPNHQPNSKPVQVQISSPDRPAKRRSSKPQAAAAVSSRSLSNPPGQGYECVICKKYLTSSNSYRRHNKRYHSSNVICNICSVGFTDSRALTVHKKISHVVYSEKQFACTLCPSSFTRARTLSEHMVGHSGTPYECNDCGQKFKLKAYLNRHTNRKHPNTTEKKLSFCITCKRNFASSRGLEQHLQTVTHAAYKTRVQCSDCDEMFANKTSHALHIKHQHCVRSSLNRRRFRRKSRCVADNEPEDLGLAFSLNVENSVLRYNLRNKSRVGSASVNISIDESDWMEE